MIGVASAEQLRMPDPIGVRRTVTRRELPVPSRGRCQGPVHLPARCGCHGGVSKTTKRGCRRQPQAAAYAWDIVSTPNIFDPDGTRVEYMQERINHSHALSYIRRYSETPISIAMPYALLLLF